MFALIRQSTCAQRKVSFAASRQIATSSVLFQRKKADIVRQQEDHNEIPKELISGAPSELITERVVRIYKDAKPATQSGTYGSHFWKIDWDVLMKGHRWENDLIGYQSSADYMQGTQMKFDTKEAAIRFAQGQGWAFTVQEPNERHFEKKDYSKNFYHSRTKLKHIRTK